MNLNSEKLSESKLQQLVTHFPFQAPQVSTNMTGQSGTNDTNLILDKLFSKVIKFKENQ